MYSIFYFTLSTFFDKSNLRLKIYNQHEEDVNFTCKEILAML